jgi:hypothetical protein
VQADPRATDPWRSVKDTKILGKRKSKESSSSESEESGAYKNKKKKGA